jgi:hypothetical protein
MSTNPIHSKYEWNNKYHTVIIDGIYMRGITDVLKCTFYPKYRFKKAIYGPDTSLDKCQPSSTGKHGKALGKLIDTELGKYHKVGTINNISKETQIIINFLSSRDIKMVSCQFAVADKISRMCTCIDLLGVLPGGKYVIIEIKTGYRGYVQKYVTNMNSPFKSLTDCPYNQHQLQLYATTELFKKCHPKQRSQSLLLYVGEDNLLGFELMKDDSYHELFFSSVQIEKEKTRGERHGRKRKNRVCDQKNKTWKTNKYVRK